MSVSAAVSYTNSSGSVKVVCGSYKKTFTAKKYGKNFCEALNTALYTVRTKAKASKKATVTISKGYYKLDRTIIVYSNTILKAKGSYFRYYGNLLRNGFDKNKTAGYGYKSASNITITGGEWEQLVDYNNAGSSNPSIMHSTFRFAHCKNITVKNAAFKNNYNCHDIEIAGVKDSEFFNNNFYNKKSVNTVENDGGRESFQIDVNTSSSMPYFPSYDKTPCKNIKIHDNTFKNKFRAIGSHHAVTGKTFNNISVYKNKMENIAGISIYAVYWTNSKIYSNEMTNVGCGIDARSMINNPVALNFYNLDKLSYQRSEQAAAKSKLFIYSNKIKIRAKENILTKPCGIRALGDYYSKDDKETGTKAGVYRVYNVNVGVDSKGKSKPNTISGNFSVGVQLNYAVNSYVKNNNIDLSSSAFNTAYGVELKGCDGVTASANIIKNGTTDKARGIYAYESPSGLLNSRVTVSDNTISNIKYAGVAIQKTDKATVENNTVTDCVNASLIVNSTVDAVCSGNNFSGGKYGLLCSDYTDGVSFNLNNVSDVTTGMYLKKVKNITAEQNTLSASSSGVRGDLAENVTLKNNTIDSKQYGAALYNDSYNVVLSLNTINSLSSCVYSKNNTPDAVILSDDNTIVCPEGVEVIKTVSPLTV